MAKTSFIGLFLVLSGLAYAEPPKVSLPTDRLVFDDQRTLRPSRQSQNSSDFRKLMTDGQKFDEGTSDRVRMRLKDLPARSLKDELKESGAGLRLKDLEMGPGSGGGGNICLQTISREAQILKTRIENNPVLPLSPEIIASLRSVLDEARISEEPDLYRNGEKVDALNFPELALIVFDSEFCKRVAVIASAPIQAFILHEAFGLLRIDDSDFLLSGTYLRSQLNHASLYRSFDLQDGFDFRKFPPEAAVQRGRNVTSVFRIPPIQVWPRFYIPKVAVVRNVKGAEDLDLEIISDNGNGSTFRDRSPGDTYMTSSYFLSSGSFRLQENVLTYPCLKNEKKKVCADDTVVMTNGYKTQVVGFSLSPSGGRTRILVPRTKFVPGPEHIHMDDIQEIVKSPLQEKLSNQIHRAPQSEKEMNSETLEDVFISIDQRLSTAQKNVPSSKDLKNLFESSERISGAGSMCRLGIREHLLSLSEKIRKWSVFAGHKSLIENLSASAKTVELDFKKDLTLDGLKVDAINYPSAGVIRFESDICDRSLLKDPVKFETFLLHEMLGLNLIDDRDYRISNSFYLEQIGQISFAAFKKYKPVLFDSDLMKQIQWKDRPVLVLDKRSAALSIFSFIESMNPRVFSEFRTLQTVRMFWKDEATPDAGKKRYFLKSDFEWLAEAQQIFLGEDFFNGQSGVKFIPCATASSEFQMICVGDVLAQEDGQKFEVIGLPLSSAISEPRILFKKLDGKAVFTFETMPLQGIHLKLLTRKYYF